MPSVISQKDFEKSSAVSKVIDEIKADNFSLQICEWGCTNFANITGAAMLNQNAEIMADFLDAGACEILFAVMTKHSSNSEIVTSLGCSAISNLSWSSVEMRDFLGELGCCELVVYAISYHIGEPRVSEFGSCAIINLAQDNMSNTFRLANTGALDIMSQLGNFGFNLRSTQSVVVAANTCIAFAQMAEAFNTAKLLECGACELILNLLKVHRKHDKVVESAVTALCGLASLNPRLRDLLGDIECCEIIVKILKKYDHLPLVTQKAAETILHLSVSLENTLKLVKAHAFEVIMVAFESRLKDKPMGPEICLEAIHNLLKNDDDENNETNINKLKDLSIVELIRSLKANASTTKRCKELGNLILIHIRAVTKEFVLAEEKAAEDEEAAFNRGTDSDSQHGWKETGDDDDDDDGFDSDSGGYPVTTKMKEVMFKLRRSSAHMSSRALKMLGLEPHQISQNGMNHNNGSPTSTNGQPASAPPIAKNGTSILSKSNDRRLLREYDSRMNGPAGFEDDDD